MRLVPAALRRRPSSSLPSLSARFHVAFGLVSLLSTVVLVATFAGVVPDRASTVRDGRVALSEALASAGSMLLRRGDVDGLSRALEFTVARNDDLVGVDLVRGGRGGTTTFGVPAPDAAVGETPDATGSVAGAVGVPLLRGGREWGQLRFRFADGASLPWWERARRSPFAPVVFIALAGFAAFYLYLGKVLKQLDPSAAVPGRVRSALDSIAECLVVVDRRGDLVLANAAFAELAGEDATALIGRSLSALGWVAPDDGPDGSDEGEPSSGAGAIAERPWARSLADGVAVHQARASYTDAAGRVRRFLVNCSPVLDPKGGVGGVLVSMDDVTRLEEQEILLRESTRAAEEANATKSAFLSNMSHEIRTPMTAILGFTDVLRRGAANDPSTRERHLATISSSGQHLLGLINDLLDLSKVEAGSMEVESIPTSPVAVAHEVIETLGVKAREKGIGLALEIDTPLPESVASDPARLRQILTNLAGNAIKFTEAGGVSVRLAWDGPSATLRAAVRDSGIGMTEAQQATVFDAFAQADASITRRFGGTGLGLSISLRLAEALGGTIELESSPGEGSTFTLALPGLESLSGEPVPADALLASLEAARAVDAGERRLARVPVLVVDDAAENRELLLLVLGGAGLDVTLAANGREAVEARRAREGGDEGGASGDASGHGGFAAVVMDIQMPVMDGYEAAGMMRADGYEGPIVALTANAMRGFEERVLAAGFSHYETKPIDIDRLLDLLARLVGEAKTGETETGEAAGETAARPAPGSPTRDVPATPTSAEASIGAATGGCTPGASDGTGNAPIPSSLAASNPAFATIAMRFLERLDDELDTVRGAVAAPDANLVAERAHWLKGSGGTVGYACLGEPAAALELAAKADDAAGMSAALDAIEALCARLVVLEGDAARVTKAHRGAPSTGAPAVNPCDEGGEERDGLAA